MQENIHTIDRYQLTNEEILHGSPNATVQIYCNSNHPAKGLVLGGLGDFDPTAPNPLFPKMLRTCGDNSQSQPMAAAVYDTPLIQHNEYHGIGDPTGILNMPIVKDFMESLIEFALENQAHFRITANSFGGALFLTAYAASLHVLTNGKRYNDSRQETARKFMETLGNYVTDAVIYGPSVGFQDIPNFNARVIRNAATGNPLIKYTPIQPLARLTASVFGTNNMYTGKLLALNNQQKLEHAQEKSESLTLMGKAWKRICVDLKSADKVKVELGSLGINHLPNILTVISKYDHQLKYSVLNSLIEPVEKKGIVQVLRLNDDLWGKTMPDGRKPDMHSPFMNDNLWDELLDRVETCLKGN